MLALAPSHKHAGLKSGTHNLHVRGGIQKTIANDSFTAVLPNFRARMNRNVEKPVMILLSTEPGPIWKKDSLGPWKTYFWARLDLGFQ